jgi:hypothetical protein
MNLQESIRNDLELLEARRPDLKYKEAKVQGAISKVTVNLESYESGVYTKLAQRYRQLDEETKRLTQARDGLNREVTDRILSYFDAEDEVLTRVMDTVSMTLTLSKKTTAHPKPTIAHAKMMLTLPEELMEATDFITEDMLPSLIKAIELITAKYTTIKEPYEKKPALSKPKFKESVMEESDRLIGMLDRFVKRYDSKLAHLHDMIF